MDADRALLIITAALGLLALLGISTADTSGDVSDLEDEDGR
jgi:hypothetical protein